MTADLHPLREENWGHGAARRKQLTLPVAFRARRNDAYIADTFLVAGKERVRGSALVGSREARLSVGGHAWRYWPASEVSHLDAKKRWLIQWQDSEGRLHRAGSVGKEDVKRLLGA